MTGMIVAGFVVIYFFGLFIGFYLGATQLERRINNK